MPRVPAGRLLTLALATATLIPVTAGDAVAAAAKPLALGADASGAAIRVEINLPNGALSIVQHISYVNGEVTRVGEATATGLAGLFQSEGPQAALFDQLHREATTSLDGTREAADAIVPQTDIAGLVSVAAGTASSLVVPDVPTGVGSTSRASVTDLSVGIGGDLGAALAPIVTQLNEQIAALDAQITDLVDQVIAGVPAPEPVVAQLRTARDQLAALVGDLEKSIAGLTDVGGLLRVGLIQAEQQIARVGETVTSRATSKIAGLSVLGSLVNVDVVGTQSTATATGKPGGAKATVARGDLASVKVGSLVEVKATVDRISATIAGLQGPEVDALATALDQLNGVLAATGVKVVALDSVQEASADGRSATASTEGIGISIGLPSAAAVAQAVRTSEAAEQQAQQERAQQDQAAAEQAQAEGAAAEQGGEPAEGTASEDATTDEAATAEPSATPEAAPQAAEAPAAAPAAAAEAKPLLSIQLVPTAASVEALPADAPVLAAPSLPRTGGPELPLAIGTGLLVLGALGRRYLRRAAITA